LSRRFIGTAGLVQIEEDRIVMPFENQLSAPSLLRDHHRIDLLASRVSVRCITGDVTDARNAPVLGSDCPSSRRSFLRTALSDSLAFSAIIWMFRPHFLVPAGRRCGWQSRSLSLTSASNKDGRPIAVLLEPVALRAYQRDPAESANITL
jgi:hypothetical protein